MDGKYHGFGTQLCRAINEELWDKLHTHTHTPASTYGEGEHAEATISTHA